MLLYSERNSRDLYDNIKFYASDRAQNASHDVNYMPRAI